MRYGGWCGGAGTGSAGRARKDSMKKSNKRKRERSGW